MGLLILLQIVKLLGLLQEMQAIFTQSFSCLTFEKETGQFAYVANFISSNVTAIDISSNIVTATLPVGNGPFDVAI
ncbi:hypothetical protein [Bacillus thuringiensis]|uniref:hypothetical protein n=1 Tax=Bacillus thuringiensis TaxID=1428 RepID=UPI002AB4BE9F|nr:hypothetical protein [Bacillus thuringiensis]MDY7962768.1 hypothetical protein [Bacillus thuringiensis]